MDSALEITDKQFEEVIAFHGHICPGIAYGIKVSQCALERMGPRAEDEEIVAIVENDACPVDAVQVMTGCTFGKGNLLFKNHGKQAYTFFNRNVGQGIRISFKNFQPQETEFEKGAWAAYSSGDRSPEILEAIDQRKTRRISLILNATMEDLFEVKAVNQNIPDRARIFPSVSCGICQEKVMEPMARVKDGVIVCLPCSGEQAAAK